MADLPVPASDRFCPLDSRNTCAPHLLASPPPGRMHQRVLSHEHTPVEHTRARRSLPPPGAFRSLNSS